MVTIHFLRKYEIKTFATLQNIREIPMTSPQNCNKGSLFPGLSKLPLSEPPAPTTLTGTGTLLASCRASFSSPISRGTCCCARPQGGTWGDRLPTLSTDLHPQFGCSEMRSVRGRRSIPEPERRPIPLNLDSERTTLLVFATTQAIPIHRTDVFPDGPGWATVRKNCKFCFQNLQTCC